MVGKNLLSLMLKRETMKPISTEFLYLPSHYNKNEKYPVLNYIYPGPQSGSVGNYSFTIARRDFQALAELGFIVVAVDAMGTPGRSKSFHDAYYGNMGDNGLPDNITAIKQLSEIQRNGFNQGWYMGTLRWWICIYRCLT